MTELISLKEAVVLKYLRESRKLSVRNAAKVIGVSDTKINHAENGRCDLNPTLTLKLLDGYGYSYEEFMELVKGKKKVPSNDCAECIEILRSLNKEKLRIVRAILESF